MATVKPKRIQRLTTKGWKVPSGAVDVGPGTPWANPYTVGLMMNVSVTVKNEQATVTHDLIAIPMTAQNTVDAYRPLMAARITHIKGERFTEDIAYVDKWRKALTGLKGKNLVCTCAPTDPCHADVLLDLANKALPAAPK